MKRKSANKPKPKQTKRVIPPSRALSTELDAYESLSEMQKEMVEMKLQGYKYSHIMGYIKKKYGLTISEATVRWQFCDVRDGKNKMHRAYNERKAMRQEESRIIFDDMFDKLKSMVGDALIVFQNALKGNNVDAAAKVLEMVGVKNQLKPTEVSPALDMIDEILKVEKAKLKILQQSEAKDERNVGAK